MATQFRTAKKPSSVNNVLKVAGIILATSATLGFLLGRYVSPPYEDSTLGPAAIAAYVSKNGFFKLGPAKLKRGPTGRLEEIGRDPLVIGFVCSPNTFAYDTAAEKVTLRPTNPNELVYGDWMSRIRKPLPNLDVVLGALIGFTGSATYNVHKSAVEFTTLLQTSSKSAKAYLFAAAGMALGSGFALGFAWAYRPDPRCGDSAISKILSDPATWKLILQKARTKTAFIVEWDDNELQRISWGASPFGSAGSTVTNEKYDIPREWIICDLVEGGDAIETEMIFRFLFENEIRSRGTRLPSITSECTTSYYSTMKNPFRLRP